MPSVVTACSTLKSCVLQHAQTPTSLSVEHGKENVTVVLPFPVYAILMLICIELGTYICKMLSIPFSARQPFVLLIIVW